MEYTKEFEEYWRSRAAELWGLIQEPQCKQEVYLAWLAGYQGGLNFARKVYNDLNKKEI